jgi:hypothetical protein
MLRSDRIIKLLLRVTKAKRGNMPTAPEKNMTLAKSPEASSLHHSPIARMSTLNSLAHSSLLRRPYMRKVRYTR